MEQVEKYQWFDFQEICILIISCYFSTLRYRYKCRPDPVAYVFDDLNLWGDPIEDVRKVYNRANKTVSITFRDWL